VTGLPSSEWQDWAGVVVKTCSGSAEEGDIQECAVQFSSARRWFLASQLTRAIPDRTRRFFRGEALHRWSDLTADDVVRLNGSREDLIQLLQERYSFTWTRAMAEADSFVSDIEARVRSASGTTGQGYAAAQGSILKIPA
jgi:hypothetical protein